MLLEMVMTIGLGLPLVIVGLWVLTLRRVVDVNFVHIVQGRTSTVSYGPGMPAGNSYYEWPSWMPFIGITTSKLPLSNFSLMLEGYQAYDVGRAPLEVDIMGFFRVEEPNTAAKRCADVNVLKMQLQGVLQSAVRTILAREDIEQIMSERSKFGDAFTNEVGVHLKEWGVIPVKSIELMDIRDSDNGKTISNIMAKKTSQIERESRVVVAENKRRAQEAEIEANQAVLVRMQESEQAVGQRTAMKVKEVGISEELAQQEVKVQKRTTAEREMEVQRVNHVKTAEINRDVEIVLADQERQKLVIRASGQKEATTTTAEGDMSAQKLHAEGIRAEGTARADAEKAMQLAPVQAQIELFDKVQSNTAYQDYMLKIRDVERLETVGKEQAQALQHADIKVIISGGSNASEGLNSVGDFFSVKGGTHLGAMAEAFLQTPAGQELGAKFGLVKPGKAA